MTDTQKPRNKSIRNLSCIDDRHPEILDIRSGKLGKILFNEDGTPNLDEIAKQMTDYANVNSAMYQIVERFASGMSPGYKAYSVKAVIEQIEEHIRDRQREAVEDYIEERTDDN